MKKKEKRIFCPKDYLLTDIGEDAIIKENEQEELFMAEKISLAIDISHTSELSEFVFGHNLEHTRAAVSGGLSAQMLKNRKFAGMPSRNEGVASKWFGIGEKTLFYAERDAYTRHEGCEGMHRRNDLQSQTVQNMMLGQKAGIGQYEIALSKGKTYELRTVTRVSKPLILTVELTDRAGKTVYGHTEFQLASGEWQVNEGKITSAVYDPDGAIRYTITEQAKIVFGALSMLPEGHFHGMRRDVVRDMKAIAPGILRWPGGNFAGEYRWKDGLMPSDQRGPLEAIMENETQPYSDGYDHHEINVDDFIALCREVGAEPFLTINLCWSTPQESAEWVEYCNGSEHTPYGKIRAERGHREPYQVTYWSLGNEMGYGHMEGPMTPEAYAELAGKHAKAMKAVTPDLKLFSSGPYPNAAWAENSAAALVPDAAYVSLHHYCGPRRIYISPEDIRETYRQTVDSVEELREKAVKMRECLDAAGKSLHISFDEWNQWYSWYRPSCVSEGMFTAKTIHFLMSNWEALDMPVCCYFQPVGEGAILINPYESRLTANGQAFKLLSAHKGGELCRVTGAGEDAVATRKGDVLTLTVINTAYDEEKEYVTEVNGKVIGSRLLSAGDVTPHSFFEETDLAVEEKGGKKSILLPPHSVALLHIQMN